MFYTKEDLMEAYMEGYNSAINNASKKVEFSLESEFEHHFNESIYDEMTALEKAVYMESISPEDKKDIRDIHHTAKKYMDSKDANMITKDLVAGTSRKQDGTYTLDNEKYEKRIEDHFKNNYKNLSKRSKNPTAEDYDKVSQNFKNIIDRNKERFGAKK